MNIPVFLDKVFQEYISVEKTTTIRSIKKYLEKYKGDIKFFVNDKTNSNFFNTNKYDNYNLSSIWNQMKAPSIEISSEDQFKYTSKDMVFKIMDEMDDFTLLNFCKVNNQRDSEGVLYCNNEKFWENRLLIKYPLLIKFKRKNETYKKFYLEMVYYLSKLKENYGIPYIPNKNYNPKNYYIKMAYYINKFDEAMFYAAEGGHMDIVKLMIEKGANTFNNAMAWAAYEGHKDIVKLMIEKGADDFNSAMINAARRGHMDIVQLMVEKGADDFDKAMADAAGGGHMDIVQLMIEKGANDFNWAMSRAAKGGYMDIIKLMIEKGADDFDMAIDWAARGGHMDIVDLMIKGADDFNEAMKSAAYGKIRI